ncbi:hypothetical protein BDV18DRAFT_161381 [Aspergillus unguis]
MPPKHPTPIPERIPSPGPKQDPTERRRLQNRLSQRNHRRKIRDRIAKLQERVIASELRAAASFNGWHAAPTPCIPYEVKPGPSPCSSSSTSSPSAASMASTSDSSTLSLSVPTSGSPSPDEMRFPSSYGVGLDVMPQFPAMAAPYEDGSGISLHGSGSGSGSGTSSPTTVAPPDNLSGPVFGTGQGLGLGLGLDTMQMCEQWGFQGSVYLATENNLPQILQTLNPSTNAIIVVPSGIAGSLGYTSGLELRCQCECLGWMRCPVHGM